MNRSEAPQRLVKSNRSRLRGGLIGFSPEGAKPLVFGAVLGGEALHHDQFDVLLRSEASPIVLRAQLRVSKSTRGLSTPAHGANLVGLV